MPDLKVTSKDFCKGGWIPLRHSAREEDRSPSLFLDGVAPGAKSLAVTMDDASHPIFPNYNHWVVWNLPVLHQIPAAIPPGKRVESLGGAIQGRAYGRNRYKGPKPPLRSVHTYVFTVYVLDCLCDLPPEARRGDLLKQIEGHVLQKATLSGKFQSP